jgi:outer membrane lipoprotein SlyB
MTTSKLSKTLFVAALASACMLASAQTMVTPGAQTPAPAPAQPVKPAPVAPAPVQAAPSYTPPPQINVPAAVASARKDIVCADCGVVTQINERREKGKASGVGAVGGAVAGGMVGNQMGKGDGNTVATVGGAVVGGVVGNQIEKNLKRRKVWDVTVKLDNGQATVVKLESKPDLAAGQRVRVAPGVVTKI